MLINVIYRCCLGHNYKHFMFCHLIILLFCTLDLHVCLTVIKILFLLDVLKITFILKILCSDTYKCTGPVQQRILADTGHTCLPLYQADTDRYPYSHTVPALNLQGYSYMVDMNLQRWLGHHSNLLHNWKIRANRFLLLFKQSQG